MASARRILTYGLALVGLFATLYAVSNLLSLLLTTLLRSTLPAAGGDTRQELSLDLAVLIVGLPLWLGPATAANRRAGRNAEERDALERRLFLGVVFAVTSLVALFAGHTLLSAVLASPGAPGATPDWRGAIAAGARLLAYGLAWLYHARFGWRERDPQVGDQAHDLAVYVLAGSALACLVYGLGDALRRIVNNLVGSGGFSGFDWPGWSDTVGRVLVGGAVWGAVQRYDLLRGGRRILRVRYLYLVLLVAVPSTLWAGTDCLYEALRRLFGYRGGADFLVEVVPTLVVGGAVWAYHWCLVRAQEAPASEAPLPAESIPWPRRPGLALLTLLGLSILVPGAVSLVWLALDALFNPTKHGSDWWRDGVSGGLSAVVVGGMVWYGAWSVLQDAATAAPFVERTTKARRLLLGSVVLINTLTAVGFAMALLWILLRALLGDRPDSDALSKALQYLSTTVILSSVAVAHALLLRADFWTHAVVTAVPRLGALVAAEADEALLSLRRCVDRPIELLGRLAALDDLPGRVDLPVLQGMIVTLGTVEQEGCDSVLLLVQPAGGSLIRYTTASARRHSAGSSGELS